MSERKKTKGMLTRQQKKKGKLSFKFELSFSLDDEDEGSVANDCISTLPDEVLAMILSPLPVREAARTSVLSKRWRHVWSSALKLDLTL